MPTPQKTSDKLFRLNVRVDKATRDFIEAEVNSGKYKSSHELIRTLLKKARGGASEAEDIQATVLNSLANTDQEIDMLRQQTNALFSLIQAATRELLSCMPDLPTDQKRLVAATVNKRWSNILQAVSKDFRSGSSTTLDSAMGTTER